MLDVKILFSHTCPTCNMMLPLIEEIIADFSEKVCAEWIDADAHPDVYEMYQIEIVPTILFYKKGVEVARMAGMIGEEILRERIEKSTCISR